MIFNYNVHLRSENMHQLSCNYVVEADVIARRTHNWTAQHGRIYHAVLCDAEICMAGVTGYI